MGSDRIRAITDAAEWFAQAAREAEAAGNHSRAAAFFKAALAVIGGQSLEQVRANLERADILLPAQEGAAAVDDRDASRGGDRSGSDGGDAGE
jgi:aryl-alcohol dehydrogenase-like predicted oxidoreductase